MRSPSAGDAETKTKPPNKHVTIRLWKAVRTRRSDSGGSTKINPAARECLRVFLAPIESGMRTIISLCAPSVCCTTALAVWGTLQLWHPASLLGWAGVATIWAICLLVSFRFHMAMAGTLIPDAPGRQDSIRRQSERLRRIAEINDAMIDDQAIRPRERLERR